MYCMWRGENPSRMDCRHQLCWLDTNGAGELTRVTMGAALAHVYRASMGRRQMPAKQHMNAHQLKLFVRRQENRCR